MTGSTERTLFLQRKTSDAACHIIEGSEEENLLSLRTKQLNRKNAWHVRIWELGPRIEDYVTNLVAKFAEYALRFNSTEIVRVNCVCHSRVRGRRGDVTCPAIAVQIRKV
jgi:hypothetical protein